VSRLNQCPQKRGIVQKFRIVSPKKPNSAKRKVARVMLSTKLVVSTKIRGQGHNLHPYSNVLVSGGRANDLPGVRYSMIRGARDFFGPTETFERAKGRSKYGIKRDSYAAPKDAILYDEDEQEETSEEISEE
jgi:small subunit ribosomal protein S12